MIAMQLYGNPKICIISAYAPTEVSTDEKAKDDFYYSLESLATSLPPHTITITADGDGDAGKLEKALIETSHEILGKPQKHKQPHWVTSTSLALIEAQNQAKKLHKANPTTTSKKRWAQLQKDATEALQ